MIKIFQYLCSFLGTKKIVYTFLLILIHLNSSYAHEINKNEIELIKKYAQAFACFSMFLIGAPLGSLIKRGGRPISQPILKIETWDREQMKI